MNPSLEIGKLPIVAKTALGQILDPDDLWKKLMAIIPETLSKNNFECNISAQNHAKYRTEHFWMIENGAVKYKKSSTEILLDEWGTSGRIRPTLGHLKYLLIKAELFRAADYVCVELLKEDSPDRPTSGPAARIPIDSEEISENHDIKEILNDMKYPSGIENLNNFSLDTNINYSTQNNLGVVPRIVISESPESSRIPSVVQNGQFLPDLSIFRTNSEVTNGEQENVPNLSDLMAEVRSGTSSESEESSTSRSLSNSNQLNGDSEPHPVIPNFNLLLMSDESRISNSRSCNSPLPNLSLKTSLPHLTYAELGEATRNFDTTALKDGGRFLGRGHFGEVYFANLHKKDLPEDLAVKKIILNNTGEVALDDDITKMFKNEVEILSEYRHENLLSLLGYSCDGDTYCLLYEYVSGGTLKDRLQSQTNKLFWTDRLHIAWGTAKAISYLHTANPTPLIHRDVKSANILLDHTNKPKLADFGLIKLLPSQNTYVGSNAFGTPAYMSPEASRGDISVKLDTFSFGVVLLELLTSLPPLDRDRKDADLVTHVDTCCENNIGILLDVSVGDWKTRDADIASDLYNIANMCLMEKKNRRPEMKNVNLQLASLIKSIAE